MPRRRDPWDGRFPPPSSPRPVDGGLTARSRRGAIGQTWWSARFLELLVSFGMGARLDRGKTYARKGQVVSMDVEPGAVDAVVQGSRARPYRVSIAIDRLSEADWRRAEDAMVSRAAFLAKLLAGDMPDDIEQAFDGGSVGLFPTARRELATACSCPDPANPCKHIAAVFFLLAEGFDDDPFLILQWRGRPRVELLDNLRALRGSEETVPASQHEGDDPWSDVEAVEAVGRGASGGGFWDVGDALTGLRLDPARPAEADAVLRGLAPLDREVAGAPLTELLAPGYAAITAAAHVRLTTT